MYAGGRTLARRATVNAAAVWDRLERTAAFDREKERHSQGAGAARRPGPWGAGDPRPELRIWHLREALANARTRAGYVLVEHSTISVPRAAVEALLGVCSDLALTWGAAALLGNPHITALVDTHTVTWALEAFGLPGTVSGFDGASLADVRRYHVLGVARSWAQSPFLNRQEEAVTLLVRGHVLLAGVLIRGMAADIVSERAGLARLGRVTAPPSEAPVLHAIRRSACLGVFAADWLAANAAALSIVPDIDPTPRASTSSLDEPMLAPPPREARARAAPLPASTSVKFA